MQAGASRTASLCRGEGYGVRDPSTASRGARGRSCAVGFGNEELGWSWPSDADWRGICPSHDLASSLQLNQTRR